MLTFVFGRQGSGKSAYLYRAAAQAAAQSVRRQIFLVPETHSHEAERRLCEAGGDSISLSCEVLTFRRLANRVFAEYGGLADRVLDDGGRILLMQNAFESVRTSMKYYVGAAGPELLEGFVKVVDEFKSCCLDDGAIMPLLPEFDSVLSAKLHDLLLIRAAYDAQCAGRFTDPRDEMTRLADAVRALDWFSGRRVYIDGFSGFTPQEYAILASLSRAEVYAALDFDPADPDSELFAKSRETAARLAKLVGDGHAESIALPPPQRHADLAVLEQGLFDYTAAPSEIVPQHIELTAAPGIFAECELAAARILRLLREGLRCREIVVVSGDFDAYRLPLESALERFGIPFYITQKTDLRVKSVTALILRAVRIAASGFRHEDVFSYLKTGLTGIPRADIDLLENYCLQWRVKPGQWTAQLPWGMNPDGFGVPLTEDGAALLARLNDIRQRIIQPLTRLGSRLRGEDSALDKVRAVYEFSLEIGLPAACDARAEELRAAGELTQADEYRQLWEIFCRCLDSFADISGDRAISAHDFEQLFTLILSRYDIGTIPPAIDRVACGDLSRLRAADARAVLVLGARDGALPVPGDGGGLLTDADREELTSYDIELAYTPSGRDADGLSEVYHVLAKARELLYLSYPAADSSGNQIRPAYLVRRLCSLFPALTVRQCSSRDDAYLLESPHTALDYAALHGDAAEAAIFDVLRELSGDEPEKPVHPDSVLPEERISEANVPGLYGRELRLSATRMDSFNTCRFAYFSRYGLNLQPRREAGFDAPQRGLFIHFVLEGTVHRVQEAGGFSACTREEVREFARACVLDYIARDIPDFQTKTARFQYLFHRIRHSLDILIDNLYDEFSKSSFLPLDFELSFSEDMPPVQIKTRHGSATLRGIADRVDGWVRNGVLYVRVVDYKSGSKAFSYGEIMNGLGMQMPVYLFALRQDAQRYLARHPAIGADAIVPAGILYTPARAEPCSAPHDLPDEELREKLDMALARSGIVLSDPEVIEAMEPGIESEGRFIPVKLLKNRQPSAASGVADAGQFALLERHVRRMTALTAELMAEGQIGARPAVTNGVQACTYCDYKSVCFFDADRDAARIRHIPAMNAKEFYGILEGGEDNGSHMD
ncbi:MAG: PD-(D/E)XK nuclease family protein [Clostridiaceae bacterium]|nr:PD-(D/E)XK nuclease family protein [Clostridiaceae bacterium]